MIEDTHFPLEVKDHSVSKKIFKLVRDENLDLLYTSPAPHGTELASYYESDDYISHTDGKRSLFEKAYHFVKRIALNRKVKLISSRQPAKGTLLDIGAGTGDFLLAAKSEGWEVTGIEPSEKAKAIGIAKGVNFSDSLNEFATSSFDVITMWHVLEHVPDPQQQMLDLKRLLRPEGVILIAVPNHKSYDAKIYKEFWAAYDVPRHLWHFSKTSIAKLGAKAGLVLEETLPMPFDAFYVSLLSEKYKHGSMKPISAFLNGLKSNMKAKKTGEYSSLIYVLKHDTSSNR